MNPHDIDTAVWQAYQQRVVVRLPDHKQKHFTNIDFSGNEYRYYVLFFDYKEIKQTSLIVFI